MEKEKLLEVILLFFFVFFDKISKKKNYISLHLSDLESSLGEYWLVFDGNTMDKIPSNNTTMPSIISNIMDVFWYI